MKTEDLIGKLIEDGAPVKRVRTPFVNGIIWTSAALFCVGVGTSVLGIREDIGLALVDPLVLTNIILTIFLGIASAFSAFVLSIPGAIKRTLFVIPALTSVAWVAVLGYGFFYHVQESNPGMGLNCVKNTLFFAVIPGLLLFTLLNKGAPLRVRATGLLAALAASAFGALGSQLLCSDNRPAHLLVWHVVPVVIIAVCGIGIGKTALKKL